MDNGNLVKFTFNLALSHKLRDSPTQGLVQTSGNAFGVFLPLKVVDYNGVGFNLSDITSDDLNFHVKSPFTD
jgi:hypothetical protein